MPSWLSELSTKAILPTDAMKKSIRRIASSRRNWSDDGNTEYVNVMIRWSGGFESRHRIMKPVQRFEWLESASEIRELIERRKREGKTHAEVSEELNREGYHSTSCGAFTSAIVSSLCKKFRDESQVDVRERKSNQWGLRELAHELGLRKETLNTWRRRGWVHATQESGPVFLSQRRKRVLNPANESLDCAIPNSV